MLAEGVDNVIKYGFHVPILLNDESDNAEDVEESLQEALAILDVDIRKRLGKLEFSSFLSAA